MIRNNTLPTGVSLMADQLARSAAQTVLGGLVLIAARVVTARRRVSGPYREHSRSGCSYKSSVTPRATPNPNKVSNGRVGQRRGSGRQLCARIDRARGRLGIVPY
jgi:hypothetical protein